MKNEYRKKSLPLKIVILFLVIALVIDLTITALSAIVYENKTTQEYKRVCLGISEAAAANINGNKVDEWIGGQKKKEYEQVEKNLINIMKSIKDIKSLGVYRMNNNGMYQIYNIGRENMKNVGVGKEVAYDSYLNPRRDALIEGNKIDVIAMQQNGNTVMRAMTPVKNQANKVACYVICEINTENIKGSCFLYAKKIFLILGLVSVLLALIISFYMNRKFVAPLGRLDERIRGFADYTDSGEEAKNKLEKIKIKGADEITRMYSGLVKLIDEVSMKADEVKEFDRNIVKQMKEFLNKNKDKE